MADSIIDSTDQRPVAPKERVYAPKGEALTGDDLITALEALPDDVRTRPLLVAVAQGSPATRIVGEVRLVAGAAVLWTEVLPL